MPVIWNHFPQDNNKRSIKFYQNILQWGRSFWFSDGFSLFGLLDNQTHRPDDRNDTFPAGIYLTFLLMFS